MAKHSHKGDGGMTGSPENYKQNRHFRELADLLPEIVFETGLGGELLYVNRKAFGVYGYTEEEFLTGLKALDMILPEERGVARKNILRVLAGEDLGWVEYKARRKDGSSFPVMIHSVPILREGQVVGMRGIIADITERKKDEQSLEESRNLYRTIFENTGSATVILVDDAVIELANSQFLALAGCSREDVAQGLLWKDFVTDEDLPRLREFHARRQGKPDEAPSAYEFRFVDRKGRIHDCIANVGIIPGTQKSVVSLLDVSERKQLEARFLHAQKLEAVGRLAGGIAHDFNNILTGILGYAELAGERFTPEDTVYSYLREIRSAAAHATDLTRQLLAFSRRQVVEPKLVDLNAVLAEQQEMIRRLIGEDVELHIRCADTAVLVKVDPAQLEQVLLNLVVNARDAMPQGGRITIETMQLESDESQALSLGRFRRPEAAVLAVHDTGTGMTPEVMDHLFEPFFTTKEKGKGTGLGLATVYGIVEQSGGVVTVASERGRGSSFRLFFPRAEQEPGSEPINLARPRQAPRTGEETILLVEDEEIVRQLSVRVLRDQGYQVIPARTGGEALALFREHEAAPVHLLLTDIILPDMNGRQVAELVCRSRPETKVLYTSGYAEDAVLKSPVREAGARFLPKPYNATALLCAVQETLAGR